MPEMVSCEFCGVQLDVYSSYIVRIDVLADPSIPPIDSQTLASFDFDVAMSQVLADAEGQSADDLQDGVHRRFEYRLCPGCQRKFLANPLGKPRDWRMGKN